MAQTTVYTEIILSKDGKKIPVREKTAFHSKYAPQKEAQAFSELFAESGFIIIFGLCGGYHISALTEKFPESKIICVEASQQDLEFLMQIEENQKLQKNSNIIFTALNNLEETIIKNYLPAIDGNLHVKGLRQWETSFPEAVEQGKTIIQKAIKLVAADYSVQKHFGKIWQKNILTNLSLTRNCPSFSDFKSFTAHIDTTKTAAIIAAGPSLNSSYSKLIKNRNEYYIISTDTAFSSLLKRGIKADIVVSIDGQNVSHVHYMTDIPKETKFVFDLCSCPSAVRKVIKNKNKFLFTESGHPLAVYASLYRGNKSFLHLESGSGTVTIAASDFALKAGFTKLELFGADFSYLDGLPYTKGTYLDSNFRKNEKRTSNAEGNFVNLLYRTEIIPVTSRKFTTEILNSYKSSMENFLSACSFEKKDEDLYFRQKAFKADDLNLSQFNFDDFKKNYISDLKKMVSADGSILKDSPAFSTILPLSASIEQAGCFIAHSKTLVYTELL